MCGRYALTLPPEAVRAYFGYDDHPNFPARFDIRPTQPVAIMRLEAGRPRFALVRWGFIPGFVKDEKDFPRELMRQKGRCLRETIAAIEASSDEPELTRIK